jgi:hypothetical protein
MFLDYFEERRRVGAWEEAGELPIASLTLLLHPFYSFLAASKG